MPAYTLTEKCLRIVYFSVLRRLDKLYLLMSLHLHNSELNICRVDLVLCLHGGVRTHLPRQPSESLRRGTYVVGCRIEGQYYLIPSRYCII